MREQMTITDDFNLDEARRKLMAHPGVSLLSTKFGVPAKVIFWNDRSQKMAYKYARSGVVAIMVSHLDYTLLEHPDRPQTYADLYLISLTLGISDRTAIRRYKRHRHMTLTNEYYGQAMIEIMAELNADKSQHSESMVAYNPQLRMIDVWMHQANTNNRIPVRWNPF